MLLLCLFLLVSWINLVSSSFIISIGFLKFVDTSIEFIYVGVSLQQKYLSNFLLSWEPDWILRFKRFKWDNENVVLDFVYYFNYN